MLPRLIFVTGKGGTGKSTVAAAMALALARRRPTTLADLDRRRSALRLLGSLNGDGGVKTLKLAEHLEGVALSPHAELETFIERIVPVKAISRRMLKSRTFGYVTAALPGLEAFLMLERLRIMAGEAALKDHYVVVDGPASGSALEFLSVADGVKGIAPIGTLNRLASGVHGFLIDAARFGVAITVTPEEMALRRNTIAEYTIRARTQLTAAGLRVIELPTLFLPELGRREAGQLADKIARALPEQ